MLVILIDFLLHVSCSEAKKNPKKKSLTGDNYFYILTNYSIQWISPHKLKLQGPETLNFDLGKIQIVKTCGLWASFVEEDSFKFDLCGLNCTCICGYNKAVSACMAIVMRFGLVRWWGKWSGDWQQPRCHAASAGTRSEESRRCEPHFVPTARVSREEREVGAPGETHQACHPDWLCRYELELHAVRVCRSVWCRSKTKVGLL